MQGSIQQHKPRYNCGKTVAKVNQRLTILLIEDDEDLQKVIQCGFKLTSTYNTFCLKSNENWLLYATGLEPGLSIDLIILDSPLNRESILTTLHNNEITRHVPTICLVARGRTQDQLCIKRMGASAIIEKPFDFFALMRTTDRLLDQ